MAIILKKIRTHSVLELNQQHRLNSAGYCHDMFYSLIQNCKIQLKCDLTRMSFPASFSFFTYLLGVLFPSHLSKSNKQTDVLLTLKVFHRSGHFLAIPPPLLLVRLCIKAGCIYALFFNLQSSWDWTLFRLAICSDY